MNTIFHKLALIAFSILPVISYSQPYPGYPSHETSAAPQPPNTDFIKKVRFPTNQLPEGRFSEVSLPRFLAAAYDQHAITSPDFKDVKCIKVKNLLTKGGFNTAQLLKVTAGCGALAHDYILKEATDALGEAVNLEAVKNHPGINTISAPSERDGFPTLALPIAILSTVGDHPHIVTLSPLAKGEEFCNFMQKHKNLTTKADESAVEKAYFELGRELTNLHREYKLVHRDLKCLNLFYDGQRFGPIDLETMAASFQEPERCDAQGDDGKCKVRASDGSQDYEKILFGNYSRNESSEIRHIFDGVDLSRWYNASFASFLKGSIETYPVARRREALAELRRTFSADFAGFSMEYDQDKINEVRTKYLIPIMDKVERSLAK